MSNAVGSRRTETRQENVRRPLLITGCGRSGSLYTSRALTAAGLPCSHERVFTGRDSDQWPLTAGASEASWFAVPWLSELSSDTQVIHLVRHPLLCIGSYVDLGFFNARVREQPVLKHYAKRVLGRAPSGQYRIVQMVRRFQPEVFDPRQPAHRGAIFWLRWNLWVEDQCDRLGLSYRRVRLEDLTNVVVVDIAREIGAAPLADAEARVGSISTTTNTRGSRRGLAWSDLGRHLVSVRELAQRYGYAS